VILNYVNEKIKIRRDILMCEVECQHANAHQQKLN
jgi:hypothetical protein